MKNLSENSISKILSVIPQFYVHNPIGKLWSSKYKNVKKYIQ